MFRKTSPDPYARPVILTIIPVKGGFHAEGGDEDYVKSAIKIGYTLLGFSDHCPYIYPDGYVSHMRMLPEDAEEYIGSIRYLGEKYAGDIDIKVGFEMEWYPELIEKQKEFLMVVITRHRLPHTRSAFHSQRVRRRNRVYRLQNAQG